MKFVKSNYSGPDSDGDVNFDLELSYKNETEHDI